jgi:hypothetical protein
VSRQQGPTTQTSRGKHHTPSTPWCRPDQPEARLAHSTAVGADGELHDRVLDLLLGRPRAVSLVDTVSFAWMRDQRVDEAFAFDRRFDLEGFTRVV